MLKNGDTLFVLEKSTLGTNTISAETVAISNILILQLCCDGKQTQKLPCCSCMSKGDQSGAIWVIYKNPGCHIASDVAGIQHTMKDNSQRKDGGAFEALCQESWHTPKA